MLEKVERNREKQREREREEERERKREKERERERKRERLGGEYAVRCTVPKPWSFDRILLPSTDKPMNRGRKTKKGGKKERGVAALTKLCADELLKPDGLGPRSSNSAVQLPRGAGQPERRSMPEAPNWPQHWIPSTNQLPISMCNNETAACGQSGVDQR